MKFYIGTFWKFNPKNQELTFSDGKVVTLPSRLNLCLETLIEAHGHTVSYDELLLKVWGTVHRDSSTITSVISELRKAISNGRNDVRLIQTVPKKGYRFVGEISQVEENVDPKANTPHTDFTIASQKDFNQSFPFEPPSPNLSNTSETQENTGSSLLNPNLQSSKPQSEQVNNVAISRKPAGRHGDSVFSKWYFYALILTIFSVSASYFGVERLGNADVSEIGIKKYSNAEILTFERGLELEFDISSDGKWLVYTHQNVANRQKHIIARNLLHGTQYQLPSEVGVDHRSPNFSRDAGRIVYILDNSEECEVWIMDFNNGFVRESAKKVSECGLSGLWTTPKFSVDGNKIYFSRSEALSEPFQIILHDLTTSYERSYSAPTSDGRGDYAFSISPDGNHMAIVRNLHWGATNILIKNNSSGDMVSLVQFPYLIEHVTWMNDDELIYKNEDGQLVKHHVYTDQKSVISESTLPLSYPVVSEGRVFAYRGFISNSDILKLSNLDQDKVTVTDVVTTLYADYNPMTAQNSGLFFLSNRSGKLQIWERVQDSVRTAWDSKLPPQIQKLQYSDKHQAFFGISNNRIFKLSLQSKEMTWLGQAEKEVVHNIRLSRNEDYLYFATVKDENWSLQQMDLVSEQMEPLGINGFVVMDSVDGYLFTRFRTRGLWKFDITTGQESLLIKDFESYSSVMWDVLQDQIIWASGDTVHRYSISQNIRYESVKLDGNIRNIHCSEKLEGCLVDVFGSGESEIIELR
ncbi:MULTISPECIES: winged helix-turn-helix domain-containing protein [unclassified Pseudoalteromonas]|uniref:winged helix-turn-helix domain-containing protein n=1 Tax=unclassified Pseudoalteromonas TaxID=194690 RepID=UPI0003FF7F05|nr:MULTISPECIES: winged helix-turn-helix domain-containing protein [unclassified Pseudoalteromonas]PCC14215.1 hypothetical protein CIK86_13735 [Pseudoalteromonas sp. JB197]SJN16351.1 Transcriptional activator cadC [Pseudoalteromonas sp. JB197]